MATTTFMETQLKKYQSQQNKLRTTQALNFDKGRV